jgi:hypothetical protein
LRYVLGAYTRRKYLRKIRKAVTKAPARIAAGTSVETKDDKLFDASLASPVFPPYHDTISARSSVIVYTPYQLTEDDMLRARKRLSAPWRAIEVYY